MVDRRHSANKRDTGALVTRLDSSECRFRDVSEVISSFCGTQTYSPASPFEHTIVGNGRFCYHERILGGLYGSAHFGHYRM